MVFLISATKICELSNVHILWLVVKILLLFVPCNVYFVCGWIFGIRNCLRSIEIRFLNIIMVIVPSCVSGCCVLSSNWIISAKDVVILHVDEKSGEISLQILDE